MFKQNLRKLLLPLSLFFIFYILICITLLTFSISVTIYFVALAFFSYLLYYVLENPIDEKDREPSFFYTFGKTVSLILFSGTLLFTLFNLIYPKNFLPSDKKYDYIIVFGAGVKADGENEIINSRLDKAIVYAKEYDKCRFVLTGAKGYDEPIEEAYYMRNYMVKNGINQDRIITEPFSVNTYESIISSLELIKMDVMRRNARENIITRPFVNKKDVFDIDFLNIGFMSSDFHLTRINLMAKNKGIRIPYDIACETNPIYTIYMYLRENLSLFKALVLNQLKII